LRQIEIRELPSQAKRTAESEFTSKLKKVMKSYANEAMWHD